MTTSRGEKKLLWRFQLYSTFSLNLFFPVFLFSFGLPDERGHPADAQPCKALLGVDLAQTRDQARRPLSALAVCLRAALGNVQAHDGSVRQTFGEGGKKKEGNGVEGRGHGNGGLRRDIPHASTPPSMHLP